MSERDDYADGPRSPRRPSLAEREPAADPPPEPRARASTPTLTFWLLMAGGLLILRVVGDHPAVVGLAQPWRFLTQAAVFVGWSAASAAVDGRLRRTPRPPGPGKAP
jgi:hypothetical protein